MAANITPEVLRQFAAIQYPEAPAGLLLAALALEAAADALEEANTSAANWEQAAKRLDAGADKALEERKESQRHHARQLLELKEANAGQIASQADEIRRLREALKASNAAHAELANRLHAKY